MPALVGALDDVRAGALLSLPPGADADGPLLRLAGAARRAGRGAVRPGDRRQPAARSLRDVRAAFREAREVADVATGQPRPAPGGRRPYYRLPDLRLRGLLHLLREDARLRAFADRELGPLLSYDAEHGTTPGHRPGRLP